MTGIESYGVYIPRWRMPLDLIGKGIPGERSVAGPDEDSVTMAVAAVLNCLKNHDRSEIGGLFFASTTSPFAEKQMAVLIARAAGLREDIITADLAGSLRSGITAVKLASDVVTAGSAKRVVVVASDSRVGTPGSEEERNGGDGAAALLIGSENVALSLEASYAKANEIFDVWRRSKDTFIETWESRFDLSYGYAKSMEESIAGFMSEKKCSVRDFQKAVFYSPDSRSSADLAKRLGFDPKSQLQNPLFGKMGNTGTSFPILLLISALEEAKPGNRILVAGYGSGSDVLSFQVNDRVEQIRLQPGVKTQIESKRMVPDYIHYLKWRGLLIEKQPRLPYTVGYAAAPSIFRERDRILSLQGSRCKACGAVEYPPQRICSKCHAKDDFLPVSLSDKKGIVFTCTRDPITRELIGLVNFEGGGRALFNFTDGELADFKVGSSVEMSFRKLTLLPSDTISNYFWKVIPIRER